MEKRRSKQWSDWITALVNGSQVIPVNRMAIACLIVCLSLVSLDVGFSVLTTTLQTLGLWGSTKILSLSHLDISFAPEVWLSIIGVTLGTLVIAISIAAQHIPKITELYMGDWFSLLYMWFLIWGGCHALWAKALIETGRLRFTSVALNLYGLLPVAILVAFPYVFYVVRTLQPTTVIDRIYVHHLSQLLRLTDRQLTRGHLIKGRSPQRFHRPLELEACHQALLESLNQLENLLEYLSFKEPKLRIIQRLGHLLQVFLQLKAGIDPEFFQITQAVRRDVSFQTMVDQLPQLESHHTFYEQKVFRLLGNAYARFLEEANFDLAALCVAELRRIGAVAVEQAEPLDLVVVRFNTMLRFALKHGANHNEARHLYNLIFHYRGFIEDLIQMECRETATTCFHYLRHYGNEAYALGRMSPVLYFIVDVFAAEMRLLLILVHRQSWPIEVQGQLLDELLQVDRPPQPDPLNPGLQHLNSGVRMLQISLALFYLHVGQKTFVDRIIADLLDDRRVLGSTVFRQTLADICDRLSSAQPTFWEDTDRGNTNLYYTPHIQYLEQFSALLTAAIETIQPTEILKKPTD